MSRFSIFFVLLFIASFVNISVEAKRVSDYRFRTLSPEGGFYYDGVKSIKQDKEGFIWILMDNDLYRFDGYQYKHYYSRFKGLNTSGSWYFNNIAIDSVGHLFVSAGNGIFIYNKISDSFEKFLDNPATSIEFDNFDNLWLNDNYLYCYDRERKKMQRPLFQGKPIKYVNAFFTSRNRLLVGTYQGNIFLYDYLKKQFKSFISLPKDNVILGITERRNKLWILTVNSGLYRADIKTGRIEARYDFFCQDANEQIPAKALFCDRNGNLLIGTQRGLHIFNPDNGERFLYRHSKSDPFSIPDNSVWVIAEDYHKNIWIGTYSGGLAYVNFKQSAGFKSYSFREKELNNNVVSGFTEDSKSIWIATEGGGVNRMDKQTGIFSNYKHNMTTNSPASNNIKSMVVDSRQRLWISMFRGGLDMYDIQKNRFQHFRHEKGNANSLKNDNLRKIVLEADSGLWIAYQLNSLAISYYSFDRKTFTHYSLKESENNYIFDIVHGNNNDLWITTHKRLYRMDIKKHTIQAISLGSLSSLNAQTIYVDAANNVWIGSIGNGLIKYNPQKSQYSFYKDILKFNISTIYNICSNGGTDLWMGTDNGLFKYSIPKNRFARYDTKDGVQGPVFYPLASMKGKNGELYFGGTNGFTVVYPHKLVTNDFKPKAIISDFLIDNVSAKFDSSNSPSKAKEVFPNSISLLYNQVNFGFTFASDNFLMPEKNRFKYRLKGYDNRWKEVDAFNRSAFFSKVPPGDYTFEIMAANNDGLWSEHPTTITIKRLPAPWYSLPAYLLYLILAGYILYVILRYYNKQKKLKMELYLENLEKNKKEEIHQSQLRFFTNVSHDFRTPLSLIMATLSKMKQDGFDAHYYKLLNNNAQRLLNLVNELMDFRTVENGKMKLKIAPENINHLINEFSFDFLDYAKQRNIEFLINCDSNLDFAIYLDRQIIEKIIVNLLDNAFKYTNDGGKISIETYYSFTDIKSEYDNSYNVGNQTKTDNFFCVAIRDSGKGISGNSISKVFERFYKVETNDQNAHLGTGIGLALVKSLVLLHKGTLTIFSEKEKGTDILVGFPISRESYAYTDFALENNIIPAAATSFPQEVTEANQDVQKLPADYMKEVLLRQKKRILLVEDNADLRAVIADYLTSYYEIVEAPNGQVATQLLDETEVDLIISDIMMPVKDGITFCKEVKSDINTSHIPFFLLTAKSGIESKIEGTGSGADMYFEKPIDLHLLQLSVQNIFNQQQHLKEYYAKNYFVDSCELSTNQQDNKFLKRLGEIIESKIDKPEMDVYYIATELSMSRSKLYTKIKTMTDKSIVEFILSYRLRKAARLIAEENIPMREVMDKIGIESQSYFTRSFKKEFGETPTAFAAKHRKKSTPPSN